MYGLAYTYVVLFAVWIIGLIRHWSIGVETFWFLAAFFFLFAYMASFMIEPQSGR